MRINFFKLRSFKFIIKDVCWVIGACSWAQLAHGEAYILRPDLRATTGKDFSVLAGIQERGTKNIDKEELVYFLTMDFMYGFQVASHGFITNVGSKQLNDSVSVEVGGKIEIKDKLALGPQVRGRWDFHVHPHWTAFPIVGIALVVPRESNYSVLRSEMGIGVLFHSAGAVSIRGEITRDAWDFSERGVHFNLKAGATWHL
jgi:hypothetical protein